MSENRRKEAAMVTQKDRERLGKAVKRRREELNLTMEQIGEKGGPRRSTVGNLEVAYELPGRERTWAAWAKALDWAPDSFQRILNGLEPIEGGLNRPDPDQVRATINLTRRLLDELEQMVLAQEEEPED